MNTDREDVFRDSPRGVPDPAPAHARSKMCQCFIYVYLCLSVAMLHTLATRGSMHSGHPPFRPGQLLKEGCELVDHRLGAEGGFDAGAAGLAESTGEQGIAHQVADGSRQ